MGTPEPVVGAGGKLAPSGQRQLRELEIVREIAHAFLTASQGLEVYRLALMRVTPLVGATFSSVFLRDPADPDLLKLECAHNWPQASARYLSYLRIRVGRGPTGRAVAEQRRVEAADILADAALQEWWEPAKELGFRSMVSLPLVAERDAAGAVSFYYTEPHEFADEERHTLELLAAQLAATTRRAQLAEDLRDANLRLQRQNEALLRRIGEAELAQQLKNEFVANVSHELRTPLTSILGYTYLLREGQIGELPDEQQQVVGKIDRSAHALLRLINDLLELSQLKLGRIGVSHAATDAVLLARFAAEQVGEAPAAVRFALHAAEPRLAVTTDAEKVVKVLTNLLANAYKFTREGEVELIVRPTLDGSSVEWQVRDTGIGIGAAQKEAIFDEFRQVDGTSTRLYGGTGLGLALSKRLASLLGGEILVESEPGEGSAFTLRLPRRPAEV